MTEHSLYKDSWYIPAPYKWSKTVEEFIEHSKLLANTFTWFEHEFKLEKIGESAVYKLSYSRKDIIHAGWGQPNREIIHSENFTILAVDHKKSQDTIDIQKLIAEQCNSLNYIPESVVICLHFNQHVAHTSMSVYTTPLAVKQSRLNPTEIFLTPRDWGYGKCCYEISKSREPADRSLLLKVLKHLHTVHNEKLSDRIAELETKFLIDDFATRTIPIEDQQNYLIKYLLRHVDDQDEKINKLTEELEKMKSTFRSLGD